LNTDTGRAPEPAGDAPSAADLEVIEEQLGRPPRGVVAVAWRCPCGRPGVIKTLPRLDNGTPFPTVYYLTNPRYVAACSSLEASGLMAEMTRRLGEDENLAARYRARRVPGSRAADCRACRSAQSFMSPGGEGDGASVGAPRRGDVIVSVYPRDCSEAHRAQP